MLFHCNILALVGGGTNPQYPPNKVLIWDDHKSRCVGEFAFIFDVRAVKFRQDRIIVVLEYKIYVYNFTDLKLLQQIETLANPKGLCGLSHNPNTSVLVCPGISSMHDSCIACFTLTMDGLLLATASMKGTLIRIFNILDGTRFQEVRRGVDRAEIYSISLSPSVKWLAVSSDKGTVHIFSLRALVVGEDPPNQNVSGESPGMIHQNSSTSLDAANVGANPSSSLSFMREVTRYITEFGSQNTVMIVGMDGSFYRCSFDNVSGGEMQHQEYVRFLNINQRLKSPAT
ncbi:hypothetical protein J5N97_014436 [Dioscorea zingiberensis]|uniref:Uncharacterized protein n=1 Tax=Dioscorea zingiberensis TaxID=325984 RepID=A0A9D5HK27_9LILI|nr:hypothetical protein J5N97_014436 [Dioscorea zingiberensis]